MPKGSGGDPLTRRFGRSMAHAAREILGPDTAEIMMEYLIAIWQGHGDARLNHTRDGIEWGDASGRGGVASTTQQIQWAYEQLKLAGWGQAPQHVVLEAELKAQVASVSSVVGVDSLPPSAINALLGTISALKPAPTPALAPAKEETDE